MDKVLKHEFINTFELMTSEFKRLYPKIFNEEKTRKMNRFAKQMRDNYSFRTMSLFHYEYLKPYAQDFKDKNIKILENISLFDNLIEFKVFQEASNERKVILLNYIHQYYQCFELTSMKDDETIKQYFKNLDEKEQDEITGIIERIRKNPTVEAMMKDVKKETERHNISEEELLQNLVSGNHDKKTKNIIKKIGKKYKNKVEGDAELKNEMEPLVDKMKHLVQKKR